MDPDPRPDAIQRRFPAVRIPRLPLGTFPTPVQPAERLGRPGSTRLHCKREDRSHPRYGGNKVRKLAYVLAGLPRPVHHLITAGAQGSHHVLATILYGRQQGLEVHAVLVPQPDHPHVRDNHAWIREHATTVHEVPRQRQVPTAILRVWQDLRRQGHRPYIVPPGGSSILGTVGWVEAGLELAEQVERGECPPPDTTWVALGSMGTAAGLLVGLRLAGLESRICAVRVADLPLTTGVATGALARAVFSFLRRQGLRPPAGFHLEGLHTIHRFAGPGYGAWTPAAAEAVRLAREREGLALEVTYTGKTLAACLEAVRSGEAGHEALFVNTANAHPISRLTVASG